MRRNRQGTDVGPGARVPMGAAIALADIIRRYALF